MRVVQPAFVRAPCINYRLSIRRVRSSKIAPAVWLLSITGRFCCSWFPTLNTELHRISVGVRACVHMDARATHADALILTTWQALLVDLAGKCRPENDFALCQQCSLSTEVCVRVRARARGGGGYEEVTAHIFCLSAANKNRKLRRRRSFMPWPQS